MCEGERCGWRSYSKIKIIIPATESLIVEMRD